MQTHWTIKNLFHPIQPSVSSSQKDVYYLEKKPSALLSDHIYCYWELKTPNPLSAPFNYRVVSDGCIDIFFNMSDLSESFIMGFCKKFTSFSIGHAFHYVGIRFYPSAYPAIFKIDASTLSDKDQRLESIDPSFADFLKNLHALTFEGICLALNVYLENVISQKTVAIDARFSTALIAILAANGHIEIDKIPNLHISPRQLRRLFNYYIGTSPKSFAQVIRFQYILNAKPSAQSLKDNKIYYDVGFYDQAHFIKTFKRFYGVSPSTAFSY